MSTSCYKEKIKQFFSLHVNYFLLVLIRKEISIIGKSIEYYITKTTASAENLPHGMGQASRRSNGSGDNKKPGKAGKSP